MKENLICSRQKKSNLDTHIHIRHFIVRKKEGVNNFFADSQRMLSIQLLFLQLELTSKLKQ